MMDSVLYQTIIFGIPLVVTPWKVLGYTGVVLFAGRWFVQVIASKIMGKPTIPRLFWYMSISGSLLLLTYFTFSRRDSVGILSNLFPMTVSTYNLWLDIRHAKRSKAAEQAAVQEPAE